MANIEATHRVIALIIYTITLMIVHYFLIESSFLPSEKVLWLYNGIASLLFGSRLLNPHFTPPAGAATNGFLVILAMLAASMAVPPNTVDLKMVIGIGTFGALVLTASLIVLIARTPAGLETRTWLDGLDQTVRRLGSPNVIYTAVVLGAVWLFHRDTPIEVIAILATWTVIVALMPVEGALAVARLLWNLGTGKLPSRVVGVIAAHQSPGIVLVRQTEAENVERGTPLLVSVDRGPRSLAVALNYVGRDEGNLLRLLTFPVPRALAARVKGASVSIADGVAARIDITEADKADIPLTHPASILKRIDGLCGIVDEGTTLDFLQFEVVDDEDLSEGRLVEATIAAKPVLFQVIEGITREEIVQKKNKYGYARARARKIGCWNADENKFDPVAWLPRINAPVLLHADEEVATRAEAVGYFPRTPYSVGFDVSKAVTHNTARRSWCGR